MAPFFPVYVRRSDGKAAVAKSPSSKETNEPLPEQLDKTPNTQGVCDYYRECQPGETKEIDWRRKLAGMLIREIGGAEHKDKNFILVALPENYRLFEHVRCKVSEVDGKTPKPSKSHAAGGNERQDAYLYGHPQGRKKRYRSPAEFFPHLLWLSTDEKGDPNNCSCKFCSPEELESDEKPKLQAKEAKQQAPKQETPSTTTAVEQQPQAPKQSTQNSLPPLPRFRRNEQKIDSQFKHFLYRPGELIWFQRGEAWGLGVIIQRDTPSNAPQRLQYRVQPLSHPLSHPTALICSQSQIRAWLSWSPPPCMCAELNPSPSNNNRLYTYDTVDWQAYINGRYGPGGDAEVDASILAAKSVERTYTLFDIVDSKTSTKESGQTSEIHYNGIFLGAEKIWVGEPLRVRNSTNVNDMVILQGIIERANLQDPSRSQVTLIGDVYSQMIAQLDPSGIPKDNEHLPPRVRGELDARNAISQTAPDPSRRFTFYWKLEIRSQQFAIADIKGRWYESSILMPTLTPDDYKIQIKQGELGEAGMWMNGHGDSNKPVNAAQGAFRPADIRVKKREDAFGRAVPSAFKISKGADDSKSGATTASNAGADIKVERPAHAPPAFSPPAQTPSHSSSARQQVDSNQQYPPPPQQQQQTQPTLHEQPPPTTGEVNQQQQRSPHVSQAQSESQYLYNHNPTVQHPGQFADGQYQHHEHQPQQEPMPDANFDEYMNFADGEHGGGAGATGVPSQHFNPYGSHAYDDHGFESNFFTADEEMSHQ